MLVLRVGEPVGSLWGLRRLGTWGEDEAAEAAKYNRLPGDVKYEDLNGDGKINSEDNTIIGRRWATIVCWFCGVQAFKFDLKPFATPDRSSAL